MVVVVVGSSGSADRGVVVRMDGSGGCNGGGGSVASGSCSGGGNRKRERGCTVWG